MTPHLCLLLLLLAPLHAAAAQAITIGPNVQVSRARQALIHEEVMAGADPTNPNRLVACAMLLPTLTPGTPDGRTIAYVSHDAGRTWQVGVEDSASVNDSLAPSFLDYRRVSWDPTCGYAADGTLYFGTGTMVGDVRRRDPRARVHRSFDGGRTWAPPVLTDTTFDDKPILVDDPHPGSPYHGRLYLTYLNRDARTPSHGLTIVSSPTRGNRFEHPVHVAVRDSIPILQAKNMGPGPFGGAVLSDGTLVLLLNGQQPVVVVSNDGGRRFAVRQIAPPPKEDTLCACASMGLAIAADNSGGVFQDRLYVAWPMKVEGRPQVVVASSSDRGVTWSAPQAVSDALSHPTRPDLEYELAAVAVNRQGVVGVAWREKRRLADHARFHLRFSASLDGGETWLPSVRVSEQPNLIRNAILDPRPRSVAGPNRGARPSQRPGRGGHGERAPLQGSLYTNVPGEGHFMGLTASAGGVFFPLWVDNRTGVSQMWTAAVRVAGTAARHGDAALGGYEDVSDKLVLHTHGLTFTRTSPTTATVTGKVYVQNRSAEPVDASDTGSGVLLARFVSLRSPVANVSVGGSRNDLRGAGAVLDLSSALRSSRGRLAPGAFSAGVPVRFTLTDVQVARAARDPESYDMTVDYAVRMLMRRSGEARTQAAGRAE